MAQRLIFVCCGATAAMRRGCFPCDEPMDPRYRARAESMAARFPGASRVLTGPALRARQTAEAFGGEVLEDAALADQDFGEWSGKELTDVGTADLSAWLSDPHAAPPAGETFGQVCARVRGFMDRLLGGNGLTLAITHPATIRAAILTALGASPACFARIDVEPLSLVEFRGDGRRWMLRTPGAGFPEPLPPGA